MEISSWLNSRKKISFENKEIVERWLCSLKNYIPKPAGAQRSCCRELYALTKYLNAGLKNNLLDFPFCIAKKECPDFIIELSDKTTIGLEHTEATTENLKQTLAKWRKQPKEAYAMETSANESHLVPSG